MRIVLGSSGGTSGGTEREVRAPSPEDAYAGALLVLLTHSVTGTDPTPAG